MRAALALAIGGVVAGVAALLLVLVQAIATPVSDEAWLQRLRDSGALVQAEEPVDAATAELIRQSLMGNVLTRWRARRELSRRLMG